MTFRPASEELLAGSDDLQASLASLSRLSTGTLGLEDLLVQVATFAAQAIPGADGAGLTMIEDNRGDTIVASAPFVREIDAIQYGIGEGPCISAVAERATMRSGSLGGEPRWPRFGPRAGRMGVHSVLSLPLLTPEGVFGAMNVYAYNKNAFDDQAARIGELFAVPAAIAVQNAQVLAQARRVAATLQAALNARAVIDQAVGILMSRAGYSADEAFDRLRHMSQTQNTKLAVVARSIVDEAVRRARSRHTGGSPGRSVGHNGANATDPDPPSPRTPCDATAPHGPGRTEQRSGRPGALPVDISAVLAADLTQLTDALADPGADLTGMVAGLHENLTTAISSAVGLAITVRVAGTEVCVSTVGSDLGDSAGPPAVTSLAVPLVVAG